MTKSRLWRLAALALAVAACAGSILWWRDYRERPYRELRKALGEIQMALERFAVDASGAYPPTVEAAFASYHKELPDNPFGPGKVKLLKPGDPWERGGIVYIAANCVEMVSRGSPPDTDSYPYSVGAYVLFAYDSRWHLSRERPEASAEVIEDKVAHAVADMSEGGWVTVRRNEEAFTMLRRELVDTEASRIGELRIPYQVGFIAH